MNILESAEELRGKSLAFSAAAAREYDVLAAAIGEILDTEENTCLQLCLQNFKASERKELNRLFKKMCANLETHWQKTKGQKQRIEVQ